jgi:hypothetical protein
VSLAKVFETARRLELPLLAGMLLAAAVFARTRCPEASFDIWWHLATGRWIVENGVVPRADPFSYTRADAPWVAHEWASDVLLYKLYYLWGLYGLSVFRQVVCTATALLLYVLCLRRGAHPLVGYAAGLLLIQFLGPTLNARPQLLLPLLFVIQVHLLSAHRSGRRWAMVGIPLLSVFWANCHGGFIILFVVLGIYALDRLLSAPSDAGTLTPRQYFGLNRLNVRAFGEVVGVGALSAVATLLNPNGIAGAVYPMQYFAGEVKFYTRVITEYASPDFSQNYMLVPGLGLIALIGLLCVSRVVPTIFDTLLLMFATYSFLRWQRMIGIFGVVVLLALAQHLTAYLRLRYRPSPSATNPVFVISVLGVAVLLFWLGWPWRYALEKMVEMKRYPARALEVARLNGVRGHLFNTYHYGGYILWQCYGERVVFIDGRADLYGQRLFEEYQTIMEANAGWGQLMEKYDIAWVLIERERPLAKVLREDARWHLLYGDRKDVLFVRDGPPNEEVVRRWREGTLRRASASILPSGALGDRRG